MFFLNKNLLKKSEKLHTRILAATSFACITVIFAEFIYYFSENKNRFKKFFSPVKNEQINSKK